MRTLRLFNIFEKDNVIRFGFLLGFLVRFGVLLFFLWLLSQKSFRKSPEARKNIERERPKKASKPEKKKKNFQQVRTPKNTIEIGQTPKSPQKNLRNLRKNTGTAEEI